MYRPLKRISPLLSKFKILWHHYPELSLAELVQETTLAANMVNSKLPQISLFDIEDVEYPAGSMFHARNLEMGIEALNKQHKNMPVPPVPIQTAMLKKVEEIWSNNSRMRLGQLLSLPNLVEEILLAGINP